MDQNFKNKNHFILFPQIKLRATIDAVLLNAARDLRTKADNVVRAFNKRIACMDEARIRLEQDLVDVSFKGITYGTS